MHSNTHHVVIVFHVLNVSSLLWCTIRNKQEIVITPYGSRDHVDDIFSELSALSLVHAQGKGFGFVQFVIPEGAIKAMEALDRHAFQGRLLHIIPARQQPGAPGVEGDLFGKGARCVRIVLSSTCSVQVQQRCICLCNENEVNAIFSKRLMK